MLMINKKNQQNERIDLVQTETYDNSSIDLALGTVVDSHSWKVLQEEGNHDDAFLLAAKLDPTMRRCARISTFAGNDCFPRATLRGRGFLPMMFPWEITGT